MRACIFKHIFNRTTFNKERRLRFMHNKRGPILYVVGIIAITQLTFVALP